VAVALPKPNAARKSHGGAGKFLHKTDGPDGSEHLAGRGRPVAAILSRTHRQEKVLSEQRQSRMG